MSYNSGTDTVTPSFPSMQSSTKSTLSPQSGTYGYGPNSGPSMSPANDDPRGSYPPQFTELDSSTLPNPQYPQQYHSNQRDTSPYTSPMCWEAWKEPKGQFHDPRTKLSHILSKVEKDTTTKNWINPELKKIKFWAEMTNRGGTSSGLDYQDPLLITARKSMVDLRDKLASQGGKWEDEVKAMDVATSYMPINPDGTVNTHNAEVWNCTLNEAMHSHFHPWVSSAAGYAWTGAKTIGTTVGGLAWDVCKRTAGYGTDSQTAPAVPANWSPQVYDGKFQELPPTYFGSGIQSELTGSPVSPTTKWGGTLSGLTGRLFGKAKKDTHSVFDLNPFG